MDDNRGPIQENPGFLRRKTKRPRSIQGAKPARSKPRLTPMPSLTPERRSYVLSLMAASCALGLFGGLVVLNALGVEDFMTSLTLAVLIGVGAAMATKHTLAPAHARPRSPDVNPVVKASPITVRLAEENDAKDPGNRQAKWLLPGDLRNVYYDDRHHAIYLPELFEEMYLRSYQGKRRLMRAVRNCSLSALVAMVLAIVVAAWPLHIHTAEGIIVAALVGIGSVALYTVYGLWYCLRHTRLIVTRRIMAEIRLTWPWIPSKTSYVYTQTLTEPNSTQGTWARILGFSHHHIETTEQHPAIQEWNYARRKGALDYALNAFAVPETHAE